MLKIDEPKVVDLLLHKVQVVNIFLLRTFYNIIKLKIIFVHNAIFYTVYIINDNTYKMYYYMYESCGYV